MKKHVWKKPETVRVVLCVRWQCPECRYTNNDDVDGHVKPGQVKCYACDSCFEVA